MAANREIARLSWLLLCCGAVSVQADEASTITVGEAWAQMARRETANPVCIRGTVTFSDSSLGLAYLQDESAGIAFDPRGFSTILRPGDAIEVKGYLSRRDGVAILLGNRQQNSPPEVSRTSAEGTQMQPLRFDLNDAAQMRIDGLLARVSGVIRRIVRSDEGRGMQIEISTPSGYVMARLPWEEPAQELRRWVNAPVTVTAVLVCRALPPLLPDGADALLLVPARSDWKVQPEALREVFAKPAVKAASAIHGAPRATPRQRVHVMGTVTAAKPREWLTLRTEEGSVEVTTRQTNVFAPGEVLSVACWPLNKNGRLLLQDGVCRSLSEGAGPAPVKLEQGFFNLNMQRELVEITGTVRDHTFNGANPRYLIALPNGLQCTLKWDELMRRDQLPTLQDGSVVRLTGIFVANPNGGLQDDGAGFGLLPRNAADITVLRGPSWWTRQRLEWTIWGLLAVVGIALPGAAAFRWQVWRQARHIRDIEGRAAAGEERRRIAREFHDSLQQQLAAAALHLETVKGAVDAAPEMLPRLLDDTTAMIRHCQLEAQHCIWDLRTDSPAREDLAASLDAWLRSRSAAEAARVEFHMEGELPPLEEAAPFQILRICQEAVNNALAHAGASRITVTLRGDVTGVSIKVVDNGRGFDRGLLESPKYGHFGLDSLRERARHIGARLEISTMLHKGTTVSLHMPKNNKKHEKAF